MYSARLSLGWGNSPIDRKRRRRVSFVTQVRTRDAARLLAGNLPSNEQTGQIAQNSASNGSDRIGTPNFPQAGQRWSSIGGVTGRLSGATRASPGIALALYTVTVEGGYRCHRNPVQKFQRGLGDAGGRSSCSGSFAAGNVPCCSSGESSGASPGTSGNVSGTPTSNAECISAVEGHRPLARKKSPRHRSFSEEYGTSYPPSDGDDPGEYQRYGREDREAEQSEEGEP